MREVVFSSPLAVLCTAVVRRVSLCSRDQFCARGYPASDPCPPRVVLCTGCYFVRVKNHFT